MNPTVLAVLLLIIGAIIFVVVQDWFGPNIDAAKPKFLTPSPAHT